MIDPISSCVSGTLEMSVEGAHNGFIAICAVRCPSARSRIFLQAGSWTSSPIANPPAFPHSCLTYVSYRALSSNAEKRFISTVQEKVSFPRSVWIVHQWARVGKGIGTGFPKHSIFRLSITLRKRSHVFITKLVCHITSTSLQSFLCKKKRKK